MKEKMKNKGGRPLKNKEETRKYKEITVGLTKKEYDKIVEKGTRLNCSIAEYLRESALNVKILEKRDPKEIRKMTSELMKIGANVNQIARKMNQNIQINDVFLRQDVLKINEKLAQILEQL